MPTGCILDDRFRETCHLGGIQLSFQAPIYAVGGLCDEGFSDMAAWRRAIGLSLGETDLEKLRMIARSRTEPGSRGGGAAIPVGFWENSAVFAVGQALGAHHPTVQRCVERAGAQD